MAKTNTLIPVSPDDSEAFDRVLKQGGEVIAQLEEGGAQYRVAMDESGEFDLKLHKAAEAKAGQASGLHGLKDLLNPSS
jgi:hypothetical protein